MYKNVLQLETGNLFYKPVRLGLYIFYLYRHMSTSVINLVFEMKRRESRANRFNVNVPNREEKIIKIAEKLELIEKIVFFFIQPSGTLRGS